MGLAPPPKREPPMRHRNKTTRLDELQAMLYRVRQLKEPDPSILQQLEKAICDLSNEARSTSTKAHENSTTKPAESKQLTLR